MAVDVALRRDPSGGVSLGVIDDGTNVIQGVEGDSTAKSLHVTMWRWNTVSVAWEKWDGKMDAIVTGDLYLALDQVEGLLTAIATYILSLTSATFNALAHYHLADWIEIGNTYYLGYLEATDGWYIKQMNLTTGAVRYVKGTSGYSFADPASLSYDTFAATF